MDGDPPSHLATTVRRPSSMSPSLPLSFWTLCCWCFRVHKYGWITNGRSVRCPVCEKVFVAAELPAEPLVVEGTDMYRCDWRFFPLGFTNGYRFQAAAGTEEEAAETPRPARRPRQTARKTVRPVNFRSKPDEEDDGGDVYV